MKKFDVLQRLADCGVVAVVRAKSEEEAINIGTACTDGGVKGIEVTFTVPGAADVIKALKKAIPADKLIVGAGSVLDSETARVAILAGAEFIVAPSFNEGVAKLCNRYQVPYIPGTQTIKEIVTAMEAGCDVIKVFPGDMLGPAFIKDVKGPIPYANLMPSGGVNLENAGEWIKKGAICISSGTDLTGPAQKGDLKAGAERARLYVEAVQKARAEMKK
ncbi:MAG: bifunctional 2-keto-4-hydroxyglutarate aldolase/2-keto-3-deoxy-6-phosphogluconate aldolase [Acholeplasmatales bacterium]|nr:bifunctional 2-keto-4-hydroxyglutarate aldolase/2-keto-3-deoxy-6-phosphogluconate aldolase [Acholeplasmatales bacterium]